MRVDGASPRGLSPPAGGRLCRRVVKEKVLRIDRPAAGGLLSLTGPLAPRVADCRSAAILIKSALRDWLSVSYGIVSILVISRYAAPPYPATPDFLHGKACHTILRSLCSLTNRVPLPPHPGDRIKHLEASLRKRLYSKHGLLCPLEEGERWWRQPPKGDCISDARRAVVWFFLGRKPGC